MSAFPETTCLAVSGGQPQGRSKLLLPSAFFNTKDPENKDNFQSMDGTPLSALRTTPIGSPLAEIGTIAEGLPYSRSAFGLSPRESTEEPGHVWFNSPMNTMVEVTPYSQIYGLHPRFFDFDDQGRMQLTPTAATAVQPTPAFIPPPRPVQGYNAENFSMPTWQASRGSTRLNPGTPCASSQRVTPTGPALSNRSPIVQSISSSTAVATGLATLPTHSAQLQARATPRHKVEPCSKQILLTRSTTSLPGTVLTRVRRRSSLGGA